MKGVRQADQWDGCTRVLVRSIDGQDDHWARQDKRQALLGCELAIPGGYLLLDAARRSRVSIGQEKHRCTTSGQTVIAPSPPPPHKATPPVVATWRVCV